MAVGAGWVDAAQVASGLAAIAAAWLAVITAKTSRRVPLTDSYMGAWQSILDVLAAATQWHDAPPPEEDADLLMRRFRTADHQLSILEATLRVRVYGREIRHQLSNLVTDVLYESPDIRNLAGRPLTLEAMPREDWAVCTDEEWLQVVNSVPFASMLVSEVWDVPGDSDDIGGLMRWYYPTVLQGLNSPDSVTAPDAPPQKQLAFMLAAYVDAFLLPWIRDASREALMGRLGVRGYKSLWRQRRRAWRHSPPWRSQASHGLTLFEPTGRRP